MFRVPMAGLLAGLLAGPIAVSCLAQTSAPRFDPPVAVANASPMTNLLGDALSAYRKGNFEAALAKYQEYLKDHPKSPDAYAGIVRVYLKEKNLDLAAQTADQGLKQTDSPRLHVAHGEVLFRQGRIYEAESEWVKVVNSGYPEARAFLGLARVREALALYKGEKGMIDRAHTLDPDDPDIQDAWGETLSRAERIRYLETTLAGDNDWDAEHRLSVANYLQYLKERAKQNNASPCRLVSRVKTTETPLVRLLEDPQHLRGYGLAVFLNGHKSSLMLDTGSSGILVKRAIAERAGISKISATQVMGIGKKGGRPAYVGIADSIKIGELEFKNCPIEVMESRSVAGDEGLIGADVLEDFLVDLDFPNEKLKLSALPERPGETQSSVALKSEDDDSDDDSASNDSGQPDAAKAGEARSHAKADGAQKPAPASGPQDSYIAPEMKDYTRVFRFGHQLLIPTSIGKVPQKLFVLDTGSLVNFISPAAAREVTKVHGDSDTIVEGVSGRVDKVYSANKAILIFGHLRQENQDITAFDTTPLSENIGTEVSGFLGFATLHMLDIKIDYRDALVDFKYDAKRFGR